jgi:hypothetical protein
MMRRTRSLFGLVPFVLFMAGFVLLLQPSPAAPHPSIAPLNHRVVDAEYSKSLDRIVTVSTTPANQLHVVDPLTGGETAVDLPYAPTCVSVGPDGLFAAVGHDGWISYVDLSAMILAKMVPVSIPVGDVVLAGSGWAHVFPAYAQRWEPARSVSLESGVEVEVEELSGVAPTAARLHPGGRAVYGDANEVRRYDAGGGPAAFLYTKGSRACGNLWISEDGFRIFGACGEVFRSSDIETEDMLYNGALGSIGHIEALSDSTAAEKVAAVPRSTSPYLSPNRDAEVWTYGYRFLNPESRIKLPSFPANGQPYVSHGRFVFFSGDGIRFHVIVQADAKSGLLFDFGIFTVGPGNAQFVVHAEAGASGAIYPSGEVPVIEGGSVSFTISPDPGYEVADVLVDGVSVGKVVSYTLENVAEAHTLEASFTRVSGLSIPSLNHRVLDAEYSRQLDRIVTVSTVPTNGLHVVDPLTGGGVTVELPLAPHCVSVGPDGLFAAVGHDGWISYVDLTTPRLVKVVPVSARVRDIVLAGNGWVYAFPPDDVGAAIRSVNLASGQEEPGVPFTRSSTRSKLHPGGSILYGVEVDDELSGMEEYDISLGPAVRLYEFPYPGYYPVCGNLWFSEDGTRIFTQCGHIFRSSEIRAEDMTYSGSLSGITWIGGLDHSAAAGKIVALPSDRYNLPPGRDTEVWTYDAGSLGLDSKLKLPSLSMMGQWKPSHGRFVFFNADGSRYTMIVQADPAAGMLLDYGLFTVSPGSRQFPIRTAAGQGGAITPWGEILAVEGTSLTFHITPDRGYEVTDVLVDGVSVGKVVSYTFEHIAAAHTIEASFAYFSLPYFGMQVGNYQIMAIPRNEDKVTVRLKVARIDMSYPENTFVVEEWLGAGLVAQAWYQGLPGALGLKVSAANGEDISEFSPPLVFLREPLIEGDAWESRAAAAVDGVTVDVVLGAKVGKIKILDIPAGRFLTYPITYSMTASGPGGERSRRWTEWFAPYVGTVKSTASRLTLSGFAAMGGTVTSPPPIVAGISPSTGIGGEAAVITGFNFGSTQAGGGVRIGDDQVTRILSWSDTQIDLIVPPGVSSGPVVVSTPDWESNATTFFYAEEEPEVTGVTPAAARPGETVTIRGGNFGEGAGKVAIGTLKAKVAKGGWSHNAIVCTVPKKLGPGVYDITVTTPFGAGTLPAGFRTP